MPAFVEPMLATMGAEPFDGDDAWLFEVKWDGFRAICRRDEDGCRLIGRRRTDHTKRFGGLATLLDHLPPGTILDGEVVALRPDGTQDFTALLRGVGRGLTLAYVAFDLLYADGQPTMGETCRERRERLRPIVAALSDRRVVMSEGSVGNGIAYFGRAIAAGLEGAIAKRLDAPYRPGVRADDWVKLKARGELVAIVIGYELNAADRLKSLVIAAPSDGELRCVGKVGSGIAAELAGELLPALRAAGRPTPVVPCSGVKGRSVEPAILCRVSYAEVLASGRLRQPVLEGIVGAARSKS